MAGLFFLSWGRFDVGNPVDGHGIHRPLLAFSLSLIFTAAARSAVTYSSACSAGVEEMQRMMVDAIGVTKQEE